jgi:ArsR family metal-binding transcriptional regulator
MEELIRDYDVELVESPCAPGAPRWAAKAHLRQDIGDVLSYLNAKLQGCQCYCQARALIWRNGERRYAFRHFEIMVAPIENNEEAKKVIAEMVSLVNQVWCDRHTITPSFVEKELPGVLDLYRLLPKTNCKKCGYVTCMAFATALRQGEAQPDCCSLLLDPSEARNRGELMELLQGCC